MNGVMINFLAWQNLAMKAGIEVRGDIENPRQGLWFMSVENLCGWE